MTDKAIPLYEIPEIHERRWWILGVMAASLTVVVMSVSGLNVALPTLQESLDASNSALQWIIDSYALVFAGLLLTAGALGDRFGRRNALLFGLAVFHPVVAHPPRQRVDVGGVVVVAVDEAQLGKVAHLRCPGVVGIEHTGGGGAVERQEIPVHRQAHGAAGVGRRPDR